MNKRLREKLDKQLDKFLSNRLVGERGGYAPWTQDELNKMYEILYTIRELKEADDCDGDSTLGFVLFARNMHDSFHFNPVPRARHDEINEAVIRMTSYNHEVAQGQLKRLLVHLENNYKIVPLTREEWEAKHNPCKPKGSKT